jgi:cytochrome c oxidase subunit 2
MKSLFAVLLLCLGLAVHAVEAVPQPGTEPEIAGMTVDKAVATFHPDIFALDAQKRPVHRITDSFFTPASDIARAVSYNTWFNVLVFLPFLILPQVLLIYIIFKFRKRADGRKPATFTGNHTLEIVWTAIPCLALAVVSVPVWSLLWKMELPPPDQDKALVVAVNGKKYAWDYRYFRDDIEVGQDVVGNQEPLVLEKGRVTILNITSNDVNHAWYVPSFGVKKDAIIGRYTNAWFTPDTVGVFKGNCFELCGEGHGVMFISAVVVEPEQFALWTDLQQRRASVLKVWGAVRDGAGLDETVASYLAKDGSAAARFALRYWVALNLESQCRKPPQGKDAVTMRAAVAPARAALDRALTVH